MRAFGETPRRFSLPKNYRSETRLVHAVNTVFSLAKSPFVFPQIEFEAVTAAGKADEKPLTFAGEKKPPLQLWVWDNSRGNATKTNAEKHLPELVAAEISRLLQSDARIGTEKLRPKDFAVLVMENQQAQAMQRALAALNIPSVLHTNENLFETREAVECERLLRAIAEPGDERRIRAALCTDILGHDAVSLDKLSQDEPAWHEWLLRFRHWFDVWSQKGFIQMFRTLLLQQQVRERLLKFPDGDRRLTNVLHLSETLHQAAIENKLGVQALLNWLADQMGAEGETNEENQLRLERDEEAVQLVTIHKSKGLQYPIVFCPFSWKGARSSRNKDLYAWFHDEEGKLTLDVASDELEAHREVELRELVAERIRLLYVALTRARNLCYLVWGNFKDAETSAPAYLLHQPSNAPGDLLGATTERFKDLSDDQLMSDLDALIRASKGNDGVETIALSSLAAEQVGTPYCPEQHVQEANVLEFNHRIEDNWRITSFSAFVHGAPEESPDRDALQDDSDSDVTGSGIFAIPPSSKLGLCMHGIFEDLDFTTTSEEDIVTIVREKLVANGFSSEHEVAVVDNVRRTLALQLDPEFKVADIPRSDRLNELEFNLPVSEIAPRSLQRIFSRHEVCIPDVPARIGKLTFSPVRGILKGFIDLVFRVGDRYYLLDWKTNWLGSRIQDYGEAGMRIEMLRHDYVLQYHLYALALHKFLALRIPNYTYEQNFGGVFYIFLRGIDPARPGSGVFRDRPAYSLIVELDEKIITRRPS
jgi:exodeoxyribonuclease V beta subunit